ncbi:MAG: hypothetical protein ACJ74U_15945, partial [Jatrophihabitantaceae bacterium]
GLRAVLRRQIVKPVWSGAHRVMPALVAKPVRAVRSDRPQIEVRTLPGFRPNRQWQRLMAKHNVRWTGAGAPRSAPTRAADFTYVVNENGKVVSGFRAPVGKNSPTPFGTKGMTSPWDLYGAAMRGTIEVAVPPHFAPRNPGVWQALLAHPNVVQVDGQGRSNLPGPGPQQGSTRFRYVVQDDGWIQGAYRLKAVPPPPTIDGKQPPTRWVARKFVSNPAAGRQPAAPVKLRPATTGRQWGPAAAPQPTQPWHESLSVPMRAAGLGNLADFLGSGSLAQVQLTDRLQNHADNLGPHGPIRDVVNGLLAEQSHVQVINSDGSVRTGHQVQPDQRFVLDLTTDGSTITFVAKGPRRVQRHRFNPAHREPIALAARAGVGPGIVREAAGLQNVLPAVREAVHHQMRVAGVTAALTARNWTHIERSLAVRFGVPGARAAFSTLTAGSSIDHDIQAGGKTFTISLGAELLGLAGDPRPEDGVAVDVQAKGTINADVGEARSKSIAAGGEMSGRITLAKTLSADIHLPGIDVGVTREHQLLSSSTAKEYRRRRAGGPSTRFEYETAY